MTFKEASEKAEKMIVENRHQIYFIMGKNNNFDVIIGWTGRDEALKNGYVFPKYIMSIGEYVTNYQDYDFMDVYG